MPQVSSPYWKAIVLTFIEEIGGLQSIGLALVREFGWTFTRIGLNNTVFPEPCSLPPPAKKTGSAHPHFSRLSIWFFPCHSLPSNLTLDQTPTKVSRPHSTMHNLHLS